MVANNNNGIPTDDDGSSKAKDGSSSPPITITPTVSNVSMNNSNVMISDEEEISSLIDEDTPQDVNNNIKIIKDHKRDTSKEKYEIADIVLDEVQQQGIVVEEEESVREIDNKPTPQMRYSPKSSSKTSSSSSSLHKSFTSSSTSVSRNDSSQYSGFAVQTARLANNAKNDRVVRKSQQHSAAAAATSSSSDQNNINSIKLSMDDAKKNYLFQTAASLDEDVAYVDKLLMRVGVGVLFTWICLLLLSYWVVPAGSIQYYEGSERNAALVELSILSTAVIMKHFPLLWDMNLLDWNADDETTGGDSSGGGGIATRKRIMMMMGSKKEKFSGVLVGGLVVQFIAIMTAVIFVFFPCPVMIDPILGSRVHFIRWCEWTPLAGYMTLMTECIDAPTYDGEKLTQPWRKKFLVSSMESLSTFCGFIFPFCTNIHVWMTAMIFSCVTYSAIIFSYFEKKKLFRSCIWSGGGSADEVELYGRARMSLALHGVCTTVWTLITINYFVTSAGHLLFEQCVGSFDEQVSILMWLRAIIHDPAAPMIGECLMDLLAKCLYMTLIIEVHHRAFDESKRANRRLAELKNTMSVVWENSSDTIAISVQKMSGRISTMVSPSFFRSALIARQEQEKIEDISAILLEHKNLAVESKRESITDISRIKDDTLPDVGIKIIRKDEFPHVNVHAAAADGAFKRIGRAGDDAMTSLVVLFTDILARAWQSKSEEILFEHDTTNEDGRARTKYEVKATRLEENAVVVVVRNVSERYQRFEAEKRFVFETTARQKDAEANRFTRHEVKNGLLAAIEICGSIREHPNESDDAMSEEGRACKLENIAELDRTLHEVLDIVLAETMAREVIHEMYVPRMERIDMNYILSQTRGFRASEDQFALVCNPSPLPDLMSDQGLFKCIHGNAIRNALKYGEHRGKITTEAIYDPLDRMFTLKVINMPGPGHEKLVAMGSRASELVFSHGTRLHKDSDLGSKRSHSAGDGAWIMQKCAKIMKGNCSIKFKEDRTIFEFKVPLEVHNSSGSCDVDSFHLPLGVWGIAIDDSKIQRKLLRRFFQHAGVREANQVILGHKPEEIAGFVAFVIDFINRHPGDRFFLIADENLEMDAVSAHETISGSECIKQIRTALDTEQEARMLALVRSANDSPQDLALYDSRAHGSLPKVPLRGKDVREKVFPLWMKRFPVGEEESDAKALTEGARVTSIENLRDLTMISPAEILASIEQIDSLCVRRNDQSPDDRWPVLWDKLHQLDGDLKSVNFDGKFVRTIQMIESLKGHNHPAEFMLTWLKIRQDVVAFLSQIQR